MFTVGDLKYLYRGGRVTKTAAIAGTILGIKPVLHVDNDGRLIPLAKVKGRKTSLNALVDAMAEKNIQNYDNKTIAICHGDCIEDAEYVASLVKEKYGYGKLYYRIYRHGHRIPFRSRNSCFVFYGR